MSSDNFLEPAQNTAAFEYTQPYEPSLSGYMAPVSSKHQRCQLNSKEETDKDGYLKPNSRSTQDSSILQKTPTEGVSIRGSSMSVDTYLEPAQNTAPLRVYYAL